ncbi:MAG: acyltransferase [Sulfurimonas sp.]|uniref:acyltransferase n=1 Tax=Sulfurimonas sp. TaxID=2022749 RepID=UPI0026352185|nr:acyltransferase [Sulfurimonas sp.]MDD5371920.1 acyltransferase [Sulfurimonas sp.]
MDKYQIPNVKTFEYTKIIGLENIEFGENIIIDDFVLIYAKEKIKISNFVHIASFSSISGGGGLTMEEFSGVASGCRIVTGSDDFKDWGFGNPTIAQEFRNLKIGKIKIGKFAIIGANSIILPDVNIGEGVAVAANSLVTKNLEAWGIYVGNKKVGERNKEEVLKNYEQFLEAHEYKRVGNLFK